jgi:hypothetical protein
MNEQYSGPYVHPSFFKYHGPAEKPGNYLFICENCPSKKKPDGTLRTYSCNKKSRQNLFSHMKSEHPGLLLTFKSACQNSHTATAPTKRKLVSDCDEVEDAEITRQVTLEEAFQSKPAKRSKISFYTQEQFDGYVVDYIIEGLLPLSHVDSPAFIKLMSFISPGIIKNYKIN